MAPASTAPDERIEAIDAIRAIALFGVLTVNLVTAFRISLFQEFVADAPTLVERVVAVGLESKAFCVFALLFGIGLAMQFERLRTTGRPLYWLARRLAVLLVLGLIHLFLIWNGDILTEYALAGFLVLPMLALPPRRLLALAGACLLLYVIGPALIYRVPWPSAAELERHVAEANVVYASGGLAQVWRFSVGELPLVLSLHIWAFPRTVALFLFGAFLWRAGLFRRLPDFADELVGVAFFGITLGLALTAAHVPGRWLPLLAPVILALGYGAGLLALAQWATARRLYATLAPLGRMAFTNYLVQSLVLGWIFFGYGLGQFGKMSASTGFGLGVALYAAQVAASRWWLARHRFGPVEWLWRTLMYGMPPLAQRI